MRNIAIFASAASLLVSACDKSSDSAPASAGSASLPAPTVSAAPKEATSAAAPAAETSAYSIVLEAPDAIGITPMKGGGIARVSQLFLSLGEGPLVQDPSFVRGMKKGEAAFAIGGEWPKSAWIDATDSEGQTKLYKYFDSLGGRWEPQQILRDQEKLLDIGVIGDNVVAAIAMPSNDIRMWLVGGKGGVLPSPAAVKKPEVAEGDAPAEPAEDDGRCKVQMSSKQSFFLTGTTTGEAFAAGFECNDTGSAGAPVVERWDAKKNRGTLEKLPAPASGTLSMGGVLAISATDAWVYGNADGHAYLAHWDGKAWAAADAPFKKKMTTMTSTEDGVVFVAAEDGLYTKKPGGAWEAVVLPKSLEAFEPTGIYARNATDVWVSGKAGGKNVLLRSAKVEKSVTMPAAKDVEDTLRSNLRYLATPLCVKPYAHLFSVGPSATPVPKEFPAVKKAFEGKKFEGAKLVVEDDGRNLFVGAKATNAEQADSIVKAFIEANPKMPARVFCHDPQVKKDVDWP